MATLEFDVFLSHNGSDKPEVRELKRLLTAAGTKAWLDEDELRPGINWQPLVDLSGGYTAAATARSAVDVFAPFAQQVNAVYYPIVTT